MSTVRNSAVAGRFYPAEASELKNLVRSLLSRVESTAIVPKAIIAPHAGYVYSGPIAAVAYGRLRAAHETIRRVVLIGPAHHVPVEGLATTSAAAFATPLGEVPVDVNTVQQLSRFPQVQVRDEAFADEHCLEVHLPLLQETLADFRLVPLLVGMASMDAVAEVLEWLWGDTETLLVVSSDLSHFHDSDTARQLDGHTSRLIEELRTDELKADFACGYRAIGGLLKVAGKLGLRVQTLDVRNSGDTAGRQDRVVGYGAYAVES